MQILLRMEILGSTFSESIKESSKQKLVKEICSFLEIIQYLVEGGIHGDLSLYDYVERTIRLRLMFCLKLKSSFLPYTCDNLIHALQQVLNPFFFFLLIKIVFSMTNRSSVFQSFYFTNNNYFVSMFYPSYFTIYCCL